jgi:sarcosine oxidase
VTSPDAIVVGLGGAGGAALYHLAKRGARVVGFDRFAPGHDRGSSHGRTRVIRMAYYEHPDYVPLLRAAYRLWAELAEEAGEPLYREVGLLEAGPAEGEVVRGVLQSAERHAITIERLSAAEAMRRFSAFRLDPEWHAVFEPHAGYVLADAAQRAHVRLARAKGTEIRTGEPVLSWRRDGDGIAVKTASGETRAARLVVCPGAWANDLLANLGITFSVRRKVLLWHEAHAPAYSADGGCPVFLFETTRGVFYGIPRGDETALKVAEHTGGEVVADPLTVDRRLDETARSQNEDFVRAHLPGAVPSPVSHAVCLYPMSPDEHFVVGRDASEPRVAFAAGLSGHGFKFVSVLGEILADLTLEGSTRHPIEFLSPARDTLRASGASRAARA